MSYRQAALIFNPTAGRKRRSREVQIQKAQDALRRSVRTVEVHPTEQPGDATKLAARAIDGGSDLIVVCGGDGTVNEVIQAMAGSDAHLLTLPAGTANVLAEEVGFPTEPEAVAALLPELISYEIPLGLLRYEQPQPGKRHFLLMCGAGVDASIVYHLNIKLKEYLGQGAYFLGSLEQLQRKFPPFQIKVDGKVYESTFTLISKSRRYGGNLVIAPRAHMLSGQFEVVIFQGESPLRYLGYLAQIATRTLDQFPDVSFHRVTSVELTCLADPNIYVQVDGELAGRLPARVEISQQSIRLLLPPAYEQRLRKAERGEDEEDKDEEPFRVLRL